VIGRILPNFFADKIGPFKLVIPCAIICGGLMFSLLGIKSVYWLLAFTIRADTFTFYRNVGSMTVVAIVYGIASGACELIVFIKFNPFAFSSNADMYPHTDLALIVAVVARLSRSPAEIGYVLR
jgi:hypothetical protein